MENNNQGYSGHENPENQNQRGNNSDNFNQSESNQDSAKFNQDNDDFSREEDNMDNERNLNTGSYSGSQSTGTGASEPLERQSESDDSGWNQNESRQASENTESGESRSQDRKSEGTDWNTGSL